MGRSKKEFNIENKRFDDETYEFVIEGLKFAIRYVENNYKESRVSVRMMSLLLCEYAKEKYSPMADTAMEHLGIKTGDDLRKVIEDLQSANYLYCSFPEGLTDRLSSNQNLLIRSKMTSADIIESIRSASAIEENNANELGFL